MAAEYREHVSKKQQAASKAQAVSAKKPDLFADLPGLLKSEYGMNDDEVAVAIRNAIFTLSPGGEPPELRQELWEIRQAHQQRKAQEQQAEQSIQRFRYDLDVAARSATEDTYPDSVSYYEGQPARYARALEHKAHQLAAEATASGSYPDLTVRNLQQKVEADLASRFDKVTQKRQSRAKPAQAEAPAAKQSVATSQTSSSSTAPTPRTGPKTRAQADAEVMALLAASLK
jgi:hypothetical protein